MVKKKKEIEVKKKYIEKVWNWNEKKVGKLKMDKSFTRYLILNVPGKEQQKIKKNWMISEFKWIKEMENCHRFYSDWNQIMKQIIIENIKIPATTTNYGNYNEKWRKNNIQILLNIDLGEIFAAKAKKCIKRKNELNCFIIGVERVHKGV